MPIDMTYHPERDAKHNKTYFVRAAFQKVVSSISKEEY